MKKIKILLRKQFSFGGITKGDYGNEPFWFSNNIEDFIRPMPRFYAPYIPLEFDSPLNLSELFPNE